MSLPTTAQPLRVLYLSYDGLLDPLGRSQIWPYIARFAKQGLDVTLLSYEKESRPEILREWEARLGRKGIRWLHLPYHLKPPVVSTAWDVWRGQQTLRRFFRTWKPDIVHARSYVAALLALWTQPRTQAAFLFDIRGFWPDEKVEGGAWKPNNRIYRITKAWERRFFAACDAVVILSDRGKQILAAELGRRGLYIPIVVIPTCVDLRRFNAAGPSPSSEAPMQLTYVGSAGTCYLVEEMADFYAALRTIEPRAHLSILTGRVDAAMDQSLRRLPKDAYTVSVLPHEAVPQALAGAHAGLCFIKPVPSKLACCPTKVGESLAMGLPIVINRGVGDCDTIVEREKVGVVIEGFNAEAYAKAARQLIELLQDRPALAARCRAVAQVYFDVDKGVDRYLELYRSLRENSKKSPPDFKGPQQAAARSRAPAGLCVGE